MTICGLVFEPLRRDLNIYHSMLAVNAQRLNPLLEYDMIGQLSLPLDPVSIVGRFRGSWRRGV